MTASFTQPLDATSDLVTLIPTVILGAEVLGSEVGIVFVKSNCLRVVLVPEPASPLLSSYSSLLCLLYDC